MKCPHCLDSIFNNPDYSTVGRDVDGSWTIERQTCPACSRLIVYLVLSSAVDKHRKPTDISNQRLVHPRGSNRPPCPTQVTNGIREDYTEACLVLADSPKASAALSRRCLQHLLREKAGINDADLFSEIQQVIDSGQLPSHLSNNLHVVRIIGNFSAHPMKSERTGEILPVEEHEAEWNLDVLEGLFDFYYVQPDIQSAKRDALNEKLVEAGKQPMP